jgi:hypothetical protein
VGDRESRGKKKNNFLRTNAKDWVSLSWAREEVWYKKQSKKT